jgi:small basic protein
LDSLFGAIRASVEKKYTTLIFVTGLAFNMVVAVLITYIGDKLNLDLYMAILVAFTIRIFANIGVIKTTTVDKLWNKSNKITDQIEK